MLIEGSFPEIDPSTFSKYIGQEDTLSTKKPRKAGLILNLE